MQELRVVGHTMEASTPMVEPMREDEEEEEEEGEGVGEGKEKGSSSTDDLVQRQAPAPQWAMPVVPEFWAVGQSVREARHRSPTSSRA